MVGISVSMVGDDRYFSNNDFLLQTQKMALTFHKNALSLRAMNLLDENVQRFIREYEGTTTTLLLKKTCVQWYF